MEQVRVLTQVEQVESHFNHMSIHPLLPWLQSLPDQILILCLYLNLQLSLTPPRSGVVVVDQIPSPSLSHPQVGCT